MVTPASTEEPGPGVQSSGGLAGGLPQSAPTPKGRPAAQKGDHRVLPSALPQNLLPLLGRGLSVSSLPGSRSLGHQSGGLLRKVKAQPAAAEAFGTGGDPAEPRPTDTHSRAADARAHTAEQQQREEEEDDEEEEDEEQLTTMDTVLGTDTETGTPPPGMTPHPLVGRLLRSGLHALSAPPNFSLQDMQCQTRGAECSRKSSSPEGHHTF